MATKPCPSNSDLNLYIRGLLSESDSNSIEAHLSQCGACEEKLDSNHPISDSLFQSLRDTSFSPAPTSAEQQAAENIALEAAKGILAENNPEKLLASESIGAYELIKTLGRGGMGNVYLANHRKLKKHVAIKVLATRHLPDQSELIRRFEREIHAAGSLDHPTIVAARDAGEVDSNLFLVMDYIDGLDLSVLIRRVGTMSVADVCAIGVQIALGLSHAHAKGMVHRDIKPSNIMLNQNGHVKVLDFGLVLLNPWDEAAGEFTTIGHFLGTLDYMAPEQAERSSTVDYRADLYSLGATLFRLLTGRPPLAATPNLSPLEKLRLLSDHTPPSLKTLRPDAPLELVKLIDSLLSTDPRQRPASAANVAEKLEPLAMGADLKSLISTGISQAEQPGDVAPKPRLASYFDNNDRNRKSSGKWRWLIAAGLLPLAILAGIAITIATDQGTLRIESDAPDVQVSIHRVGKSHSKAELRIEQSGNDIRLASGEYEIRLTDTQANGFSLERNRVLITRGDNEIVRVSKEPRTVAESSSATVLLYNGRTYEEWMQVLRTDRRVSTLGQAIRAVVALANESQQFEAALASLLPARRYGNFSTIGLERDADTEDAFMNYYDDTFSKLDSSARLRAIVEEMEANHPRSDIACRFLLLTTNIRGQLASLKEQTQERELLVRLKNQLLEPIPQTGEILVGNANTSGITLAISISEGLGEVIEEAPKAIELVASIVDNPRFFRVIFPPIVPLSNQVLAVPLGLVQLVAKLGRLPDLPVAIIASSLLANTGNYVSDEDLNELLSSIHPDSRSEFCNSIQDHFRDGWRIPQNQMLVNFLVSNATNRRAFADVLREQAKSVAKQFPFDTSFAPFYLEFAERLERGKQ